MNVALRHCTPWYRDESGQSRRLLLVDCDAFYVQVARLEDPEGAGTCLGRLAPVVQAASIDEFYLDLTGTERLFGESLEVAAGHIRKTVLEETRISVSVGGGTRRLIAKLASAVAKPGGVWFGASRGRWLYRRMRGLDSSKVDPREPRRSISSGCTFLQDLKSDEDLERVLLRLCTSVTHSLRKAGLRGSSVWA